MPRNAIVLLAHGSPDPRHVRDIESLAGRISEIEDGVRVHCSFLDHGHPRPPVIAARLRLQGCDDVRLVPLQLTPAFHAQADIANSVAAMREAAPGLEVAVAPPLGPDPQVIHAALELVSRAGYEPDSATGLVLTAVGSRDPRAVAAVDLTISEEGAELAREAGWGAVRASFSEGGRYITDAATLLNRVDGMRRALCVPFLLTEGVLRDRMETTARLLGLPMIGGALADTDAMARHVLRRTAQRAAA